MSDLRAAAQQALEAMEYGQHTLKQVSENQWESRGQLAIEALRTALVEETLQCLTDVHEKMKQNFCPGCGKRSTGIHTCTPPQDHFCDTNCTWAKHAPGCVRADSVGDSKHATIAECWADKQRKPMTEEEIEQAYRHIYRNLPYEFDHCIRSWVEQGIKYAERAHGINDA